MSKEARTLPFQTTPEIALAEIRSEIGEQYGVEDPSSNNVLVATVGLSRAGKTSWAQTMNVPMVNPDQVRLAMHGHPYIPEMEELVWWHVRLMVRSLFFAGHKTVILDSCLTTHHRRNPWGTCQLWHTAFVHFPVHADFCIERAKADRRSDLLDVIRQQAKIMVAPNAMDDAGAVLTMTYEDPPVYPT